MAKKRLVNSCPVAGPDATPLAISTCIASEIHRHDLVAPADAFSLVATIDVPDDCNLARITLQAGAATIVNIASHDSAPSDAVAGAAEGLVYPLAASAALTEVLEVYPGGPLSIASTVALMLCNVVFFKGQAQ